MATARFSPAVFTAAAACFIITERDSGVWLAIMLHRLAFPLIYILGPRLLPGAIRFIRLVWRLTWDKRVPVVLRALVPLAVIYFLLPVDLIPDFARPGFGRADDLIIVALAVVLLTKLAPQRVIDEHLGKPPASDRPEDKDPSNVVDGSSRLIDE
jgi:uncharacterized membrane protein YkvA (DUF1232 family)